MYDTDPTSPFWRDPRLALHDAARQRCLDVAGGLDALRKKPEIYLPKLPRETVQNYQIRRELSEFHNLYMAAERAAAGLLIAEPPTLQADAPAALAAIVQDMDGQQTGLAVWTRGVLSHMLRGWCLAIASTPVRRGRRPTLAEEQEQNLRPHVVLYEPKDVLGAKFLRIGARLVMTQLRVLERVDVPTGYGYETVLQARVITRMARGNHEVATYRKDAQGAAVLFGPKTFIETAEIPAVEFAAAPELGFGNSGPVLVDLADMSISHYRVLNDRRWSLKQACFPWLVRIGYQEPSDGGDTTMSVNEALDLPQGGDAKWIAPPGTAFDPTKAELDDIEKRAATMSLSFLAGESTGPQRTATAAAIDQQGQDASLASIAVCLRDSLNRLGAVLDEMLGNVPRDTYFDVQTTFRGLRRDPALLGVLLKAWEAGGLSLPALLYAFKHGELPDELDVEQEAADLLAAAEAKRRADEERQRLTTDPNADPADPTGDNRRQVA